jgi:hypothetical protein
VSVVPSDSTVDDVATPDSSLLAARVSRRDRGRRHVSARGGGHLKLHPVSENGSTASDGITLYFSVGDIDAHYERASDAGIDFERAVSASR